MITEHIKVRSPHCRPTTMQEFEISAATWKKSALAQQGWSLRLSKEYLRSIMTVFVTLTFDDEHLKKFYFNPYNKWNVNCFDNLGFREDLIRRLRQIDGYQFRYVAFPEYGGDHEYIDVHGRKRRASHRPHYHCLFFFDEKIDISIFRNCVLNNWNRCLDCALDCIEVTSDAGFTRYVSKYVSKGFNEELPHELIQKVKDYKQAIKDIDNVGALERQRRTFDYHYMSAFLNWFENSRPKLMCSKGIGKIEWSEKELLDGSTLLYNGKKFEETPLSSYTKRNAYFDRQKGEVYHYYKRKGKDLEIYETPQRFDKYDWSLNDFGRRALLHQLPQRISNCRNWLVKAQLLVGSVPPVAIDYFNKCHPSSIPLEYGVSYDSLQPLRMDMSLLIATKLFYSRYDVEHLSNNLGFDVTQLSTDDLVRNWSQFYECLVNSPSDVNLYGDSPRDIVTICDINTDFYFAKQAIDRYTLLVEITQYCSYLERKKERDERKQLKHSVIDRNKRY